MNASPLVRKYAWRIWILVVVIGLIAFPEEPPEDNLGLVLRISCMIATFGTILVLARKLDRLS
jgi:hypothetical protein